MLFIKMERRSSLNSIPEHQEMTESIIDEQSMAIYEDLIDDLFEDRTVWTKWNQLTEVQRESTRKQILNKIEDRYSRIHTFRRRPSHEYDNFKNGPVNPYVFISVLTKLGIQNILISKSHEEIQNMARMWYDLDVKHGPLITSEYNKVNETDKLNESKCECKLNIEEKILLLE